MVTVSAIRPLELLQGDKVSLVNLLDGEEGSDTRLRLTDYTEVRRIMSTDEDQA
jgi:hypothetical protein